MKRPAKRQLQELFQTYYESGLFAEVEANALSLTQAFPADQFVWKVLAAQQTFAKRQSMSLVNYL